MIKKLEHKVGMSEGRTYDVIEKINELIDTVNKSEPKEEWPKLRDMYWVFNYVGEVDSWFWKNEERDNSFQSFGNCFRTKEESESARDKVRALLKSLQK